MVLGRRSQVTRGGILAVQAALLLIAITAFAMRDGLGVMTWLFAGVALAGLIVLGFARSPDSEHEEADEALRVAEEAIKREAKRLDSRRADIEKVLMAYGEWMEFPDYEEIHNVDWATAERSAQDANVGELLDRE
ncbi:MAG: hypothetical protein VCA38_13715, partial [Roseibacillus sp.]